MEPLFTIGHSTRPIEKFTDMLRGHAVTLLADVRTIPRSRYNPQFNKETLAAALKAAGIRYLHCKNLGGLRHAVKDSVNTGWRNKSFRGYADYMGTQAFSEALEEIIDYAQTGERVAMMCAEGSPFRCHRSLIADVVLVHGLEIYEIGSAARATAHKLTPFAIVENGRITYPDLLPGTSC